MILHLLGQVQLEQRGERFTPNLTKPFCLLAYLAYAETWVKRDQLAFLFWPDTHESSARRNLRQLVSRIKKMPIEGFEVTTTHLCFAPETDVRAFRVAVANQDWQAALDLYRGDLLTELTSPGLGGFDTWLELESESLHRAWRDAALNQSKVLEASGDYTAAASLLKSLLEQDILAEDIVQRYLRAAYLAGQRDQALSTFERFAEQLQQDLDLTPLDQTLQLVATIRAASEVALEPTTQPRASVPLSVLRPPHLIGRQAAVLEAKSASTALVLLSGEAGIAKSRLMEDLAPHAYRIQCQEGLQDVPYYPLKRFLNETLPTVRMRLEELGAYLEDLARLTPDGVPDVTPQPADPETGRSRLFEALARYTELLGAPEPFGFILDDLQWADEATLAFLVFLMNRGQLRLLGSYRVHEVGPTLKRTMQGLQTSGLLTKITLGPLTPADVSDLLADLIGITERPRLFAQWLTNKTGGNPIFTLETLKALFETGVLRSDQTGWHTSIDELTRDYSEIEVPAAIADVIARRLDRLPEVTRRVLQIAAVFGRGFSPKMLAQAASLSEWPAIEACDEAETNGLLKEEHFVHDLLRQSVYQALSSSRRRLLHERVALSLETQAEAAVLAEHWLAADNPVQAATYWHRAATDLMNRSLFEEAISLLERAIQYVPEQAAWPLMTTLASTYQALADFTRALPLVETVLKQDPDPATWAAALDVRANYLIKQGKLEEAHRTVQTGLGFAEQSEDVSQKRTLQNTLALIEVYLGNFEQTLALQKPLLADLRRDGPSAKLCTLLTNVASIFDQLERHDEALPLHLEALRTAKAVGTKLMQVDAALNLLYCYMDLDRTEEGLSSAQEALELGHFAGSDVLRLNLATALLELGRTSEAEHHYTLLTEQSEDPTLLSSAWSRLAELHVRRGRSAEGALEQAIVAAQQTEFNLGRARTFIAVMNYGSPAQRRAVQPFLKELNRDALAPYLREELEAILAET